MNKTFNHLQHLVSMTQRVLLLIVLLMVCSSHDMFLKPDNYYLGEHSDAVIALYNGTWNKSDNTIDRNRMIDVSIVSNGQRTQVDSTQWTEKNKTTLLHLTTGVSGTYVTGLSTYTRDFKMSSADFNDYLEHDGVMDMLEWRKKNNDLDKDAFERYSKHVKTIFQVGDTRSDDWSAVLGYPIEFVPLSNPYEAKVGDIFEVQLLRDGQPLVDQLVYYGTAHSHEHDHSHDDEDHHHHDAIQHKTNAEGIISINIEEEGVQYLRSIHMTLSSEGELTHESNWATLTFEIGHGHGHNNLNIYYLIAGILLLLLVFYFKRR